MALVDEVTPDMVTLALAFPAKGLVWTPVNGQIVYRKFVGPYVLTKLTDDHCLETDSYCVNGEAFTLSTLKDNCVWLPSPNEIRDLALVKGYTLSQLVSKTIVTTVWQVEYALTGPIVQIGTTPWEAEFMFFDKYVLGLCTQ
jgi:hypothetical protein